MKLSTKGRYAMVALADLAMAEGDGMVSLAEIARRTARWQAPTAPRGHVEFFVERMLRQGVPA